MLDFDQTRIPAVPRDAATVIALREGGDGLEVFCVLRHARSAFLGGAVVFPGGKVDPEDGTEAWATRATATSTRAQVFASASAPARALSVAACREALEEGAILPVVGGTLPDSEVSSILRQIAGGAKLEEELARRELRLDLGQLTPWARWITPEAEARRFDARFFLLPLPEGQVGRHDDHETTMSFWATPVEVLDRATRGTIFLAPPTSHTLELLATVSRMSEAVALAGQQSLSPICPRFVAGDPPYLALPGDPSHEIRERYAAGPIRYVLREGRFVSEDPPPPGNR
ncbi:NUDIX hydrolase [Chondromyces crocatus]|uniref:NUDIX hydrolase n=1 Tax=Chondromyces crocatus TaxID=52 RepID=UPI00067D6F81|nr:hypothetical protein [Chondromyces crocatus]